ncbi:MAG: helix-turn-helix transcriptional regulator, partial [Oscillospiraceae bacterium]|nr:helix-turn-helix transcriptional regulator [Oscillospiraceae bacterium]
NKENRKGVNTVESAVTVNSSRIRGRLSRLGGTIILLLVFLAMFLLLFFQFRTAALQSLTAATDSFGTYVDSLLDLSHGNIRTSAMQIFYTSSIRTLRTGDDLSWSEQIIGQRDLGNFVSSSSFIDNIMVYNGNLDMVFTSENSHVSAPSGQFHDREAVYLLLHPEEHRYLTPFKRQAGGSTHYSFLFSSGNSAMLLDINARWYETQLMGSLSPEGHIIVDGDGQPVVLTEPSTQLPDWSLFEDAFLSSPDSGYVSSDSSPFLSSCWVYHKLGQTGWYYLEFFQLENDAPGLVQIQRVVFSVFALITLAVLLLSAYLFFVVLPTFLHISRALTTVQPEGKDFTAKFDRLLSAHQAYESNRKLQELQAGVFPPDTPLPVVFIASNSDSGESLYDLLLLSCGIGDAILAHSDMGDVFVLPKCTNKSRNHVLGSLQGLKLPSPIFVSLPCYSEQQLLEAFDALEELRKLAFLYPNQSIFCQELLSDCNDPSGLQREIVSSMESALKKGQLEVAQAQWLLLLNHIRRDRYKDFHFAIHYVDKTLSSLAAEYHLSFEVPIDACLTDLATLQEHIDTRLKAITEAVNAQQQQAAESLSGAVWDKIYELYHDENCCSQMIAEQLGISPSYLNRQFRAAAGVSVGDAIQHVRIDKVCKLLRESDLPVEQIARQAGYSNTKYFFVLFKKYTGKTPSQFRSDEEE